MISKLKKVQIHAIVTQLLWVCFELRFFFIHLLVNYHLFRNDNASVLIYDMSLWYNI